MQDSLTGTKIEHSAPESKNNTDFLQEVEEE